MQRASPNTVKGGGVVGRRATQQQWKGQVGMHD